MTRSDHDGPHSGPYVNSPQQTSLQHVLRRGEVRLPLDFRLAGFEAVAEFGEGVAGHVRAAVTGTGFARVGHDAGDRQERVLRGRFFQRMNHLHFGGDEKRGRLGDGHHVLPHFFRAADVIGVLKNILRAFRVGDDLAAGVIAFRPLHVLQAEDFMHHAGSGPENHLTAGDFLQISPEVLIRHEQDFLVGRDLFDDLAGIATGDDPIAQGFDGSRGVDVRDRDEIVSFSPEFLLVFFEFRSRATVGQGTSGKQIRQQNGFLRGEDFSPTPP